MSDCNQPPIDHTCPHCNREPTSFTIQIGDLPPQFYVNTGRLEALDRKTIPLPCGTQALLPSDTGKVLPLTLDGLLDEAIRRAGWHG